MRLFYRRVITAAERPCLSKRGADRGWSLLTVPLTRELMLQGGFYYFFGRKIERLHGTDAAMPYYVAALLANPTPNAAAWSTFPKSPKTPEAAANLASKHPLPHERKSRTS